MKEAGGAIVNISSDGGLRGWAGCWIYDATKTDLWSVTKSMYLGNVVLLTFNFPLIPYIAWLIALPQRFLVPLYSFLFLDRRLLGLFQHLRHRPDDRICHGGYFFVRSYFPLAPILLGFVLGDLLEDNLRRVLLISDGQLSFLWQRPITLTILTVTVLVLLLPLARYLVAGRER